METKEKLTLLLVLCEKINPEMVVCDRIRNAIAKGRNVHLREWEKAHIWNWIRRYPELFSDKEKRVFEIYRRKW